MIVFKACLRCRGDLHHGHDIYGHYLSCLQCGYVLDQKVSPDLYDRLVKPASRCTPDAHPPQTHSGLGDEKIDTSS